MTKLLKDLETKYGVTASRDWTITLHAKAFVKSRVQVQAETKEEAEEKASALVRNQDPLPEGFKGIAELGDVVWTYDGIDAENEIEYVVS